MNNFLLDILCIGAIISGILVITSKNPVVSVLFLISVFVQVAGYLCLLGVGFIGISYLIVYVGAIAILFLFVVMMLNLQLQELTIVGKEYTQNLPLGAILGSLFLYIFVQILPFSFKDQSSFNFKEQGIPLPSGPWNGSWQEITDLIKEMKLYIVNFVNQKLFGNSSIIPVNDTTIFTNANDIHLTFNTMQADQNFQSFLQIQSIGQILYTNGMAWLILCSIILLLAMIGPISLSINTNKQSINTNHNISLFLQ
ncbi:unnamed protein product (mitochondrion) [Parajaminaea phylloscopi]|uniref:NADH-ubiquinone oxidoreductase chain 6 n=1 Tax=Parajaminaea phylloscopi TaxID=1463510 RepID=A0AB39A6X9_9BASI